MSEIEEATPGPWHAYNRGIGWEVHVGHPVASDDGTCPDGCASRVNDGFRETFTEADARLVASAPDLYEALKEVVGEMRREHDRGDGHFSTEQVESSEGALRKAEGP